MNTTRTPLKVSYLLPVNSSWHVWKGHATTKLSAYRQYIKEAKEDGREIYPSSKLELKQYGIVRRLSRGRWVSCYR